MRRLVVGNAAMADFDSIAEYTAEASGSRAAAENLLEKLYFRCERLARLPGALGSPRPELRSDLRSVPESGYIIFFRYLDEVLEIVNVLHGSRNVIVYYDTGDDR